VVIRRILKVVIVVLLSLAAVSAWAAGRPRSTTRVKSQKIVKTRKVVKKRVVRRATLVRTSRHTHRRVRVRRVVWNPLFRGSHELLVRENVQIDGLELPRIADDDELELLEDSEELVPMTDSQYLSVSSIRLPNRRYCRPWTREFLEDLSAAYYEEFHQPLVITSLVRTAEQQKKLRRRNRNAAPEEGETVSTHLTGMTFDLYKRGMSRRQHKWIEDYFLPLKEVGLIEPIEERRQPVFHVTVFDTYTQWRDSQDAPATDTAESRTVARGASN
jgi:Family of unknown function (DUF5715)